MAGRSLTRALDEKKTSIALTMRQKGVEPAYLPYGSDIDIEILEKAVYAHDSITVHRQIDKGIRPKNVDGVFLEIVEQNDISLAQKLIEKGIKPTSMAGDILLTSCRWEGKKEMGDLLAKLGYTEQTRAEMTRSSFFFHR